MHTPGPWINCHTHVDDSRGLPLVVAAVKDFDRINCADFALIAAAPALLEALEKAVERYRLTLATCPDREDYRVEFNAARDAIVAARGEGVTA